MLKYKTIFLLFIVFAFSGCIRSKTPGPEKECNANFVVDRVQGSLRISDETALPEKFTLQLKICSMRAAGLVDRKLPGTYWFLSLNKDLLPPKRMATKDIENDALYVKKLDSKERPTIYLKTDGPGCLEWSETYDYAYAKESKWIVIDRYIKGNEYTGTCKIPLAINPWLQSKDSNIQANQVVDYRTEYKDEYKDILEKEEKDLVEENGLDFLKKKKREELQNKVDIIVENLNFIPSDLDSQSSELSLTGNIIEANLKYLIKDINGNPTDNFIKQGDFKITAHLLHRDPLSEEIQAEINKNIDQKMQEESRNVDSSLSAIKNKLEELLKTKNKEQDQYIYRKINKEPLDTVISADFKTYILTSDAFDWAVPLKNDQASLHLYLKIIPQGDTAKRINPFEGIYKIGQTFDNLSGQTQIALKLNETLENKYREKISQTSQDKTNSVTSNLSAVVTESSHFLKSCLENLQIDDNFLISSPCIYTTLPNRRMDNYSGSGWTIKKMFLRHSQMKKENWLFRDIETTVETSVIDSANKPAKNKAMIIKITDLSTGETITEEKKTDRNTGDLKFTIPTRQNWYKRQRYFLKIIRFQTKETEQLDVTKIVAINPWDYGFTHGFEVDQKIRATCLESQYPRSEISKQKYKEEEKQLQDLFAHFDDILVENEKSKTSELKKPTIKPEQEKLIQKLFCYNEGYAPPKKTDNWKYIFYTFADILKQAQAGGRTLYEEFKNKFHTVKEILKPQSYVHLFRAVTKYPTYLIDHSLGRSIYYNTRFKLSPRVVRYDDITRGMQNKGPLRDGIYTLRLMIVKNDQGRVNGREAMVQAFNGEFSFPVPGGETAGTNPLYSCPSVATGTSCITLEDFIMPPTRVPVVIRDGMVKTDIPIYIDRKNFLFANSKNILVFQLQPSDPKSIICKDGMPCAEGGWTYHSDSEDSNDGWEQNIDWTQTTKKIRSAKPQDYDIYFHTYQTPIIPAEWTNWNITHEMHESYKALKKKHEALSNLNEIKLESEHLTTLLNHSLEKYDNEERNNLPENYNHDWFAQYLITQLTENKLEIQKYTQETDNSQAQEIMEKQLQSYKKEIDNSNRGAEYQTALIKYIDQLLDGTNAKNALQQRKQNIKENSDLSQEEKKVEIENINEQLRIIEEEPLMALTFLPAEVLVDKVDLNQTGSEQAESVGQILPFEKNAALEGFSSYSQDADSDVQNSSPSACVGVGHISKGQDYLKDNCPLSPEAVVLLEGEPEEDLSQKHIENFASQNALCTIGINNSDILPKSCGVDLDSAGITQSRFLEDLNHQIAIINKVKEDIKLAEQNRRKGRFSILKTGRLQKQEPVHSMSEVFQKESESSWGFANKLKDMPALTQLEPEDLENIIKLASTNLEYDNKGIIDITDNKTGAFLHSLCGFWFKDFVSQKYSSMELLKDGLRKVIKESFHYQARVFSTPFSDNEDRKTDNKADDSGPQNIQEQITENLDHILQYSTEDDETLSTLKKFKTDFTNTVQNRHKIGAIDDFHETKNLLKWANEETNFSTSDFDLSLEESLEKILKETPFHYHSPSWSNQTEVAHQEELFKAKSYLQEAVVAKQHSEHGNSALRKRQDEHPFRKCISNPSHFFGLEKKVIVGKMGKNLAYSEGGGQITRLNITESFLMNTQRDQGSNQGFNTSLSSGDLAILSSGAILGILGVATSLPPLLATATGLIAFNGLLKAGMGYDWKVYEGTGKRRWFSIAVVEGVELISERTPISIPLEKYHECLVIRPRFNAFELDSNKYEPIWNIENQAIRAIYEKTGILLCTEGKAPHTIQEDYYYIYPDHPINAISSDARGHRNRPFAISLRGKTAYHRFKDSISCEVAETTEPIKKDMECRDTRGHYENLFSKHIEFADNLEKGFETPKLFHLTGDFPGVYSPYVEKPDRDIKDDQRWYHRVTNFFARYMDLDLEKIIHKEPEQ